MIVKGKGVSGRAEQGHIYSLVPPKLARAMCIHSEKVRSPLLSILPNELDFEVCADFSVVKTASEF